MPIVAAFRDLAGAEVASATLEAAGVVNTLFDAGIVGAAWTDSTAVGWVKVHVAEEDAPEAHAILEEPTEVDWPPELGTRESVESVESGEGGESRERCPFCASEDLALVSGPRKALAIMICLSLPLWLWRSRLLCRSCGRSRWVPLRFRPDLALAFSSAALGFMLVMVGLIGGFGFLVSLLKEMSR